MVVASWILRSQSNLLTGPRPLANYPDSPAPGAKPPAAHVINTSSNQRALVGAEGQTELSDCWANAGAPASASELDLTRKTDPATAFSSWLSHCMGPQGDAPQGWLRAWAEEEVTQLLEFDQLVSKNLCPFPPWSWLENNFEASPE